jgi:hypothetical protein
MTGTSGFPATPSFQGDLTDTVLPAGGAGFGIVEFTLDYSWTACQDTLSTTLAASFTFNGSTDWSDSGARGHRCPAPITHQSTILVDELVTYGSPFTWDAGVSLNGTGDASFYEAAVSLGVSAALLTGGQLVSIPEPACLWTCAPALLVLLLRRRARQL